MSHWTTPPVNRTTPDWNQGSYQTTSLYPDDMYKRSKRFKKDDQEVTEEMDNEGYLYNKGWRGANTVSGYMYWNHPQYAATFTTDEALKKSGEMDQDENLEGEDTYEGSLLYWRDKYCEKSDELENLKKTLFEYEGELEALRKETMESGNEYRTLEAAYLNRDKDIRELGQQIKELQNRNHYLQVELDNYKIIFNENKDLEESVDRARDIFERSLANASQDDLRAFQDVLDTYHADKVMEDTEDTTVPFERTTNTFGEYPLTSYEEQMAFSPTSTPETTLEAMRMQYEHSKEMCNQMERLIEKLQDNDFLLSYGGTDD